MKGGRLVSARISQVSTLDFSGWVVLCCEGLPRASQVCIPGLYSEEAATENVSRHCHMSSGGQNCPPLRAIGLKRARGLGGLDWMVSV